MPEFFAYLWALIQIAIPLTIVSAILIAAGWYGLAGWRELAERHRKDHHDA